MQNKILCIKMNVDAVALAIHFQFTMNLLCYYDIGSNHEQFSVIQKYFDKFCLLHQQK